MNADCDILSDHLIPIELSCCPASIASGETIEFNQTSSMRLQLIIIYRRYLRYNIMCHIRLFAHSVPLMHINSYITINLCVVVKRYMSMYIAFVMSKLMHYQFCKNNRFMLL